MIRLYDYSTPVSAPPTTSTFPSGAGYDPSARGGSGTFGAGPSSKDDLKKRADGGSEGAAGGGSGNFDASFSGTIWAIERAGSKNPSRGFNTIRMSPHPYSYSCSLRTFLL